METKIKRWAKRLTITYAFSLITVVALLLNFKLGCIAIGLSLLSLMIMVYKTK